MCGIFGFVGEKSSLKRTIFESLKDLEYRGYDSWGIAWKEGRELKVIKETGKLPAGADLPKSTLALGHTRWATHGSISKENAHPHLSCDRQIAVVHNGIIDNFKVLKKKLEKAGHIFKSGTDSEVFAHLVEQNLKKEGFASSVRDAFNQIQGLNAVVVSFAGSREIIAAKTGSPLIIGVGDHSLYVSSDPLPVAKFTKRAVFLEDNQMAILGESLQIVSLPVGEKVDFEVKNLEFQSRESSIGDFKDYMLKEIYEQPQILKRISALEKEKISLVAEMIRKSYGSFLIGCGSASYAALAGTYLFSRIAKRHVNFSVGSEFDYQQDFLTERSLIVAISQSGETIDTIEPVLAAKKKGAKILAVTNVTGSTLYRVADEKVLLGAGFERAVCATKTITAMWAVLLLLAMSLVDREKEGRDLLKLASSKANWFLQSGEVKKIRKLASEIKDNPNIYIIGRGLSFPLALEAALKLKEVSYIHAEGFAGGELKHGVIALIEKGTPVVVFAPEDETREAILSNAWEIKARGGFIIGISSKNEEIFDTFIKVPSVDEASFIVYALPVQLLAYFLAKEKNLDPDKPRNLAKAVTVR